MKSNIEKPCFFDIILLNASAGDGQRHAFFGYCRIFLELLLLFTLLRRGKTNPSLLESETFWRQQTNEAVCPLGPLLQGKPCVVEADPSFIELSQPFAGTARVTARSERCLGKRRCFYTESPYSAGPHASGLPGCSVPCSRPFPVTEAALPPAGAGPGLNGAAGRWRRHRYPPPEW